MKLEPLSPEALPPAVAALVHGATQAKLMAVRGMAPLRPTELLTAIYQLSFDQDPSVQAAAESAPAGMPDRILLGALGELHLPHVLHFFAARTPPARRPVLEKILYNQHTADESFLHLAKTLDEAELEIIFQNEVRLLRCPALVEALYFNKQARMSSVSRALELCVRNNLRLDGIPGFAETAAAILADPNAAEPSESDETFAAVLAEAEVFSVDEIETLPADEGASAEAIPVEKKRAGTFIKFDRLKMHEKIRLATIGSPYCRRVLIRDTNKLVAMTAVRSPLITTEEIVLAASNRAVCEDVIRYIANSREYAKNYAVKQSLANNPKCPISLSLRLLSFLRINDLKTLAHSKNIPGALSSAAKELMNTRKKTSG